MSDITAVVLAAGKGTRMKSKLPKVLHAVGGKPMVERVVDTVEAIGAKKTVVIIGFGAEAVRGHLGDRVDYVVQEEQNGTGHAVQMTAPLLSQVKGNILVTCGDTPLVSPKTMEALVNKHVKTGAKATILSMHMSVPTGYGRIIRNDDGDVVRIVEQKDGTEEELAVHEVNAGIYIFDSESLWPCLDKLDANNAQGELYLTDVISILVSKGETVSAYMTRNAEECLGVNSRKQLAEAEAYVRDRKLSDLFDSGVTIIDPSSVYVEPEVQVGPDTILYPGTVLTGNTVIGSGCKIGPQSRMDNVCCGDDVYFHQSYAHDCTIEAEATIGPFVHIRPDSFIKKGVHIGNFVEVKNSVVGEGTKFPHLSYIGDSDVGAGVNIGCGTITVNYDGKKKHRTTIGDGAFVGCNSNLVAPVTIGDEAYVGAGSTITKDVPSRALAVGRAKQIVKESWVTDDTFKKKKK